MSADGHVIRTVRPSDLDELTRMRLALWPDSTAAEAVTVVGRPAASPPVVLVAERDGSRLSGFAEIGARRWAEGCATSPVAYLEGIWVDPDRRRDGVGLALVRGAEAWAREHGFSEMGSDCALDNLVSQVFHVALGFVEVQRSVCYVRPL